MGIKLGDVSPAAALMGSKGGLNTLFAKGVGGLLPYLATKDKDDSQEGGSPAAEPAPAMKCGGKVKKMASGGSVRGAGCAVRGVKKCKIR